MFRSRHFFGRLRLRKFEVPEPTPVSTKLGRLRLQAAPAPYTNIVHFDLLKSELIMQVFLDHIYRYKLLSSHALSQQQGFPILLAKKMQPEPP